MRVTITSRTVRIHIGEMNSILLLIASSNMSDLSIVNENHQTPTGESSYDRRNQKDQGRISGTRRNLPNLQLRPAHMSHGRACRIPSRKTESETACQEHFHLGNENSGLGMHSDKSPEHFCCREGKVLSPTFISAELSTHRTSNRPGNQVSCLNESQFPSSKVK